MIDLTQQKTKLSVSAYWSVALSAVTLPSLGIASSCVAHNLQRSQASGRFLRPPLFSKHGIVTLALISSPLPFYFRLTKDRAATHLLHLCSYSGQRAESAQTLHPWALPAARDEKLPSTTSVACRCAPWQNKEDIALKPFSHGDTLFVCRHEK